MLTSVAFATDQRSVDDCPRSTVEGSAEKLEMVGFTGAGFGFSAGGGGGGGGGAGGFLRQPAAPKRNTKAKTMTLNLRIFILNV
jgi:hypothetical protein